jgi:hypothetical protein
VASHASASWAAICRFPEPFRCVELSLARGLPYKKQPRVHLAPKVPNGVTLGLSRPAAARVTPTAYPRPHSQPSPTSLCPRVHHPHPTAARSASVRVCVGPVCGLAIGATSVCAPGDRSLRLIRGQVPQPFQRHTQSTTPPLTPKRDRFPCVILGALRAVPRSTIGETSVCRLWSPGRAQELPAIRTRTATTGRNRPRWLEVGLSQPCLTIPGSSIDHPGMTVDHPGMTTDHPGMSTDRPTPARVPRSSGRASHDHPTITQGSPGAPSRWDICGMMRARSVPALSRRTSEEREAGTS